MKKWSLDASFMIDYLSGNSYAAEALEDGKYDKLMVPSLAEAEVKWSQKDIKDFERLETLNFGPREVSECLKIKDFLRENGEMINKLDIMIAAQCVKSDSVLITRENDFRDLEGYPGFKQINFADREKT